MKYFGTDGIRGKYQGEFINEDFFKKIGAAVSVYFAGKNLKIALAGDPRYSSESLASAFCEGLKGNIEVLNFGSIPTPALAFGVLQTGADLGVMITASHNPSSDNGIKFFDSKALKASDEFQEKIENLIDEGALAEGESAKVLKQDMRLKYIEKMSSILPANSFKGLTIALDCANGATAGISGEVLRNYGAEVFEIGVSPDGKNINQEIGSEHTEKLRELLASKNAFIGLAHDGDGDRLVVCDEFANQIEGECILGLIGINEKLKGALQGGGVVTTIQSNTGLDESLKKEGIDVFRSGIGDRLVMQLMLEKNCNIGGENSGHYIFTEVSPCGDGLAAALKLLDTLLALKIKPSEISAKVSLYPCVSKALAVARKLPVNEAKNLSLAMAQAEEKLAGKGRILVRYSGTENKIRLLAEGENEQQVKEIMQKLVKSVEIDLQ